MHDDVADRGDGHQTIREALDDLAAHEAGRDARVQVLVLHVERFAPATRRGLRSDGVVKRMNDDSCAAKPTG